MVFSINTQLDNYSSIGMKIHRISQWAHVGDIHNSSKNQDISMARIFKNTFLLHVSYSHDCSIPRVSAFDVSTKVEA